MNMPVTRHVGRAKFARTSGTKDYFLVDADTLTVFGRTHSVSPDKNVLLAESAAVGKPLRYKLPKGKSGSCYVLTENLINRFAPQLELQVKTFTNSHRAVVGRKKNLKIVSNHGQRFAITTIGHQSKTILNSVFNSLNEKSLPKYWSIDISLEQQYALLMDLSKQKRIKELFKVSAKQKVSNTIMYLNEYLNNDISRDKAIAFLGEEIVLKFDQTPENKKFEFIKDLDRNYFIL